MPLPALSSTQLPEAIPDWTPLDRKRVLEHFMLSRDYENIAEYISFQSDLLPDERVILFFLHAVYANSTKTIELYALYIIGLFNYAKKSFNQLKAWDIDAYLRHLTNKGLKPSSRNTAAATLRSFFRHLVDSGVCTVNPAAFLKRKRNDGKGSLPGHLSHSLGRDELERLFAGMEEVGAPFRDIVLFRVLFMTGLRAEEAVSLKWMNVINWQGRWYLDVLGKGSKVRRVYLPQKAQAALEELRRHTSPRPEYPIFENRTVKASNPHPWAEAEAYNKLSIPKKYQPMFEDLGTVAFVIIKDSTGKIIPLNRTATHFLWPKVSYRWPSDVP